MIGDVTRLKTGSSQRMNSLQLLSATRKRNRCSYWDFYVDGKRLADTLDIGDFIPPIGWLGSDVELHFLAMLLRKTPGDLPGNRTPIYVCAECADYGCGVVSCVIERTDEGIVWRDFGTQTGDGEDVCADEFDPTLAFTFAPTAYYGTLSGHYDLAKTGG